MRPLPPPKDANDRSDAFEVIRGWVVGGDLHVSLAIESFGNNPAVWGELLAQTAVHVANALALQGGGERQAILAAINASLLENLEKPYAGLQGTIGWPVQ